MRIVMWLVVVLAACAESGDVECGDGRVCPSAYTCASFGCLSPAQVTACDAIADGESCSVPQLGNGVCGEGGCIVPFCGNLVEEPGEACDDGNQLGGDGCNGSCTSNESCGNGIVELLEECDCGDAEHPGASLCSSTVNGGTVCNETCKVRRCGDFVEDAGEECDDGNTVAGDGCNFDCTSDEICGNTILDYFRGEQCDDGNLRSHDGCSATCREETLRWHEIADTLLPERRVNSMMAYDAARGRLVLFGGNTASSSTSADTWEADGRSWLEITPRTVPGPRRGAAMVYDAKRSRIVLFGGDRGGPLDDMYEYDGTNWTRVTPATIPPARAFAMSAYDSKRDRMVLFGGSRASGEANDTWEYDGTTWIQRSPATVPTPARTHGAMVFDPVRGVTVMFGGSAAGVLLDETWEYDGTTWTKRTLNNNPAPRIATRLAFDPVRRRVVMFGGLFSTASAQAFTDTWEYDGTDWMLVSVSGAPQDGRSHHAMAFDEITRRVVLCGGSNINTNWAADCHEYDGATWAPRLPASPGVRLGAGMAHDARRGVTVLFAGLGDDQTWELRDATWVLRSLTTRPPLRNETAMAYDSKRGVIVMFGGAGQGIERADTWEYDGTWTPKSPTMSPPGRSGHRLVYDSVRERVVLFGGFNASERADTWEYDGTTWAPITTANSPPARYRFAMSYDPLRARVYVFGGLTTAAVLDDPNTWQYDGINWTPLPTAVAVHPSARYSTMAFDAARGRTILFGGGPGRNNDTWELDGSTWRELFPPSPLPIGRDFHSMAYDATHGRTVMTGGSVSGADTHVFDHTLVSPIEACRAGVDHDGDAAVGCSDDDCWGACRNACPPGAPAATCQPRPACGDAVCDGAETCRSCPADCPAGTTVCTILCGDFYCDASIETAVNCPGDCP